MRILMSMFGWNDSGGGTILPRLTAIELRKRGHEVLVIYSAVPQIPNAPAYQLHEHEDEGVQLIGVHNRPALFMDDKNPEREICDPNVVKIFQHFFDRFQPDIVHYHNFLGLSLGIAQVAYNAGTPSFYTPYNFWLLCPTLYLNLPNLALCQGVNPEGSNCLQCTQAPRIGQAYVERRDQLRARFQAQIGPCLASSVCVQDLLLANGYATEQVEILKFANERSAKIWQEAGQQREPSVPEIIKIGFTGSVIPIKGVHTLVEAAQLLNGPVEILIYGKAPEQYLNHLKQLDTQNRVQFKGFFANEDHSRILAELSLAVVPSVCYDHSPLVIGEFLAAKTPVIGANIGGIPDYIPEGCGELFEAGNAQDLARVLQKYIDAPERVPELQKNITEPLSFEAYVSTLEDRYVLSQTEGQKHLKQAQYQRWMQSRGNHTLFDAKTLHPIPSEGQEKVSSPYGVDVWSKEMLSHRKQLLEAQWITSPLLPESLINQLTTQFPEKYSLQPLQPSPHSAQQWNFREEYTTLYLLPFQAEQAEIATLLKAYLSHPPQPKTLLVLLPWQQSLDTGEAYLSDLLAELPETDHEMTLLDPEMQPEDLRALFTESTYLILTREREQDASLMPYASLPTGILRQSQPTEQTQQLQSLWHAVAENSPFEALNYTPYKSTVR